MEKTDPNFYAEIEMGIVLWEAKDESWIWEMFKKSKTWAETILKIQEL